MHSDNSRKSANPRTTTSAVLTRRRFLGSTAAAAVFTIVPRHVLGAGQTAPSDMIHMAILGTGGQGLVNMRSLLQQPDVRIVAIADPNEESDYSQWYFKGTGGRIPALKLIQESYQKKGVGSGCAEYLDYRRLLEKEKAVDAVLVATPDHAHAVVTLAALQLKKHVYTEKPLCRTVYETQKVVEAAKAANVATQMGNQGHSGEGLRLFCEWIWDGAIGPIREVHSWATFQKMTELKERPKETPPVPKRLNWDLWLGPMPDRPYHPAYCPVTWRAWYDFGVGMLGDFACHHMDPAFQALKLGLPSSIEASTVGKGKDTFPDATNAYFEFPARGEIPSVRLTWYDGGLLPATPAELDPGRRLSANGHGILFVGEKGKLLGGGWAESPRLIPEKAMQAYTRPARTLPRVPGHHRDWLDCIKSGNKPCTNILCHPKLRSSRRL